MHRVTRLLSSQAHRSGSYNGLLCIGPLESQSSGLVLLLWQSAHLQVLAGSADFAKACVADGCAPGPPTLSPCLNTSPCLQDLLTRHKAMVAVYLSEHYRSFFQDYSKLLQSSNYVTRRQSLKVSLQQSMSGCGLNPCS